MAANKKISELAVLADSGNPVLVETVRDGANFKLLCNLQATAAPTVTNDSSEGYSVGSPWNHEGMLYTLRDASVGAADWVAVNVISSLETLPATTTAGTGTANDFKVIFEKKGNTVSFNGFCRSLTVVEGEFFTTVTIELPLEYAPAIDFASSYLVHGGAVTGVIKNTIGEISTVGFVSLLSSKKIAITINLALAAAGGDFNTTISIFGSYQIDL
jgi:hypothetical protein